MYEQRSLQYFFQKVQLLQLQSCVFGGWERVHLACDLAHISMHFAANQPNDMNDILFPWKRFNL